MAPESGQSPKRATDFNAWKLILRLDCARRDKTEAFDALTDPVLKLLWESGIDPTVQAIIECAARNGRRSA